MFVQLRNSRFRSLLPNRDGDDPDQRRSKAEREWRELGEFHAIWLLKNLKGSGWFLYSSFITWWYGKNTFVLLASLAKNFFTFSTRPAL